MQKMALNKEKLTIAAEQAWDAFLGFVPSLSHALVTATCAQPTHRVVGRVVGRVVSCRVVSLVGRVL
jgi:hypothetical protein